MERHESSGISFLTGRMPFENTKPYILFIHGAGTTALSWLSQIKYFAEKVNVIVPDLSGHGQTRGSGRTSIAEYAKDIAGFIDSLKIPECILAGTSMGGGVVLEMLVNYPDYVKAGILMNTGAKLKVLPAIMEAVKKDFKGFVIGMSDILFPANTVIESMDTSLKDILAIDKKIMLNDFTACDTFDIRDRLNKIDKPVLIISSKNDIMTPVWYGEYLKNNIKNSRLVLAEGAGHLAQFEKPRVVNKAIMEFLNCHISKTII
ncbi:MAG: alpha/beta hydrolase [Spirochaetota bacterium]